MTMTKLVLLGLLSFASALATPVSALACGGGPATAAELEYLHSVQERPAEAHATAPTTTHAARRHPAGRRHASVMPRRTAH